jgi:hypothetical protein
MLLLLRYYYFQETPKMPAMDLALIESLGRDLHSHSPGYMGEDEVCPWTLFLTMALTLLKGIFPKPL